MRLLVVVFLMSAGPGSARPDTAPWRSTMIKRKGRRRAPSRLGRIAAAAAGITLAAGALSACASASAGTGPVTLNFYFNPDSSGATQDAINNCDAQSHGAYTISWQELPTAADGQRQQLVRRLAAHDS